MSILNADYIQKMLETQIQVSVEAALKRIADKACEDLRKEIMGQADALALRMIKEYDVEVGVDRILISVKKL